MPCTGPTPPSNEQIDQVTEEVWNYMKDKYKLWHFAKLPGSRTKSKQSLREAVKEILIDDICESW